MPKEESLTPETYSLETILSSITKVKDNKARKRFIFDQAPVNGLAVKWVIAFLISLPIMLYAGIFNPVMFEILGIAQAIIFFVVFLSMIMIIVVATIFVNNNKVIREITPSWENSFPNVNLKFVLSSSATPYKEFFNHYSTALSSDLKGENLEKELQENFKRMEKENQALMDAIRRNESKR